MLGRQHPHDQYHAPVAARRSEGLPEIARLTGGDAGIENLPRNRRVDLPADHLAPQFEDAAIGIVAVKRELDLGHHIGRKMMAGAAVANVRPRLVAAVAKRMQLQRHVDRPPRHLRIVNAAPEVLPVRHMAGLAGLLVPPPGVGAGKPLPVGVLHQFAGDARAVIRKLVAMRAEAAVPESRGYGKAAMRDVGGDLAARRRPEALVAAHVAGRANQALMPQAGFDIVRRRLLRCVRPAVLRRQQRFLLGQRRMTAQAAVALILIHQFELPTQAGAHCLAVQRSAPGCKLFGMALPAGLRTERGFQRRKRGRRSTLRRHRFGPVLA